MVLEWSIWAYWKIGDQKPPTFFPLSQKKEDYENTLLSNGAIPIDTNQPIENIIVKIIENTS